jgi:1,4-dihydroxy-2-naphthoate octaprenyltransferase
VTAPYRTGEGTAASADPGRARAWLLALRLPTLAAAVVPVLVGSAVAAREGFFRTGPAVAALAGALLIQVGTNFANDLYDHEKGADHPGRIGFPRVLAAGWLEPEAVRRAMLASFGAATLAGIYLVDAAGWPVVAIGLASIAAGVGYTAGRWALGYHGLGDLAVFLFFGVVAVAGTYYVQARAVSPLAVVAALPVGALCTNILVVNNIRDVDADRASGKRTLAVLLGRGAAVLEYALLLLLAYVVPVLLWLGGELGPWALLPLLTLPIALILLRVIATRRDGPSLNQALVQTARLHAIFGALFALGMIAP